MLKQIKITTYKIKPLIGAYYRLGYPKDKKVRYFSNIRLILRGKTRQYG